MLHSNETYLHVFRERATSNLSRGRHFLSERQTCFFQNSHVLPLSKGDMFFPKKPRPTCRSQPRLIYESHISSAEAMSHPKEIRFIREVHNSSEVDVWDACFTVHWLAIICTFAKVIHSSPNFNIFITWYDVSALYKLPFARLICRLI